MKELRRFGGRRCSSLRSCSAFGGNVSGGGVGRGGVRRSGVRRSSIGMDRSGISRCSIAVLADDNVGQVSVVVGVVGDGMHGSIGHAGVPVTVLFAGSDVLLAGLLVAVVVVDGIVVVHDLGLHIRRLKWVHC